LYFWAIFFECIVWKMLPRSTPTNRQNRIYSTFFTRRVRTCHWGRTSIHNFDKKKNTMHCNGGRNEWKANWVSQNIKSIFFFVYHNKKKKFFNFQPAVLFSGKVPQFYFLVFKNFFDNYNLILGPICLCSFIRATGQME